MQSEEINAIVGRIPPWIVRWGMTVMFSMVLLIFIISYWIRYPDSIVTDITLNYETPPSITKSPLDGIIEKVWVENGKYVKKGDTIISLHNNVLTDKVRWEDIFFLRSKISGVVSFSDFWKEHQNVNKGELLYAISDENSGPISYGKILLSLDNGAKVKKGQKVFIYVDSNPSSESDFLLGTVNSISSIPINNQYLIGVNLNSSSKTNSLVNGMNGKAEIILEEKSLMNRILSLRISKLKQ